jgi:endonuclease G
VAGGYDPEFLPGQRLEPPNPATDEIEKDLAPTKQDEHVRHYTHFSLAMSASRRFCRWVAWNIDGNGLQALSRTGLEFVLDDEYDPKFQVDDDLYSRNRLDRGHIARRADLLWGTRDEAEQANKDSFFFTNITPQLDDFNQSGQHGLWGEVENAIFENVEVEQLRVSLFGGPIFKDNDFPYRDTFVPRSFWKVVAYVEQGALKAQAFVLTQDDLESKLPSFGLEQFKLYQVALGDLSEMTGLDFGDLPKVDTIDDHPGAIAPRVRRIEARSQIAAA